MNFVFVSLQRINTDRESTSTCLAKELSKRHNVLYVNSPLDRKTLFSKHNDEFIEAHLRSVKTDNNLFQLQKNLWVLHPKRVIESINWLPTTSLFSFFNRINNKRLASDIQEALKKLKFDNFILINDKDIFRSFYLKELLRPDKYIYLDRDYTIGMPYWKKHGTTLEPLLMEKADAVVCNSTDFATRARKYNPNSFYIGNGGDVEYSGQESTTFVPDDLKNIPGPRIGYVGALTSLRLDIGLMTTLAQTRPDWSFVLVGPEDEAFLQSPLHNLNNVYFLGKKHKNQASAYIAQCDVCINPQLVNEITIGNFPMKVVEYLAMGKPVVATATNTMKEVFSTNTYLAEDAVSFMHQIERALEEDNAELSLERKNFSRKFSWENVATSLLSTIDKVKKSKSLVLS